jgi:Uma2 family endonuclease
LSYTSAEADMTARTQIDVGEYLRTSFEGADCEYLDGEVVERNMGELPHSWVQMELAYLLRQKASEWSIQVYPEIRIRIHQRRYRVADLAVWRAGDIGDRIPTVPPFLAVEILSSEDRIIRMQPKVEEYLSIGVEWVWLIDPDERKAICYSQDRPAGVLTDTLKTDSPPIQIPLETLFRSR